MFDSYVPAPDMHGQSYPQIFMHEIILKTIEIIKKKIREIINNET